MQRFGCMAKSIRYIRVNKVRHDMLESTYRVFL